MIIAVLAAFLMQADATTLNGSEQLIAWSISDFEAHPPGDVRGFRKVHTGTFGDGRSARLQLLCGEIQIQQPDGVTSWVRFATVKTGVYEQWIGGAAKSYCKEGARLDTRRDFSRRFTESLVLRR